ncbi:MAG TPA: xanthine dehydrogenase family protein subunit M [Gemmatimonadales bacterium]|nr:xanthine dehydrogenase family protein subunit M [Gemmatimonadales bacterium]
MKPAPFEYHRPASLDEALTLFAELGSNAKALAGGQSLVPAMNFRLARPGVLVDLNRIESLSGIEELPSGGLRIGAMTRQRAVERSAAVASRAPLLAETMPWIAHPQIRNRGTVGGSLAHADPSAELPAVMLALDARFVAERRGGKRTIPAGDFFTGILSTALADDELLAAVEIDPPAPRSGSAFVELARRHGDYALVGVAAAVGLDSQGACAEVRIALLSAGDTAVLATNAMASLAGRRPDPPAIDEASRMAAERDIDPPADIHASRAYRRHLARVLVGRALRAAFARTAR